MNAQKLFHGDCLDVLKTMESDSVDSLVTDPPAGIAFMGKDWDKDKGGRTEWVAWMRDVMTEVHRVLKPGAHGLVWALPRTSHWTALALEDAGFEIRDSIYHIFGSGFPKSLDVSKAIDKAAGAEREVIGANPNARPNSQKNYSLDGKSKNFSIDVQPITTPATDAAKQWQGFGTALKPAVECWWLVRKPLGEKTVAKNVLKHGTGAMNIDASRVGSNPGYSYPNGAGGSSFSVGAGVDGTRTKPVESSQGRFPSHLVLSHSIHCTTVLHHDRETDGMSDTQHCVSDCPVRQLDEQSGILKTNAMSATNTAQPETSMFRAGKNITKPNLISSSGGASRFFFNSKYDECDKQISCKRPANSAKNHSMLDSILDAFALKLAAIVEALEDKRLRSTTILFTKDIQSELSKANESSTEAIHSIAQKFLLELEHTNTLSLSPASLAAIQKLTDITTTILNLSTLSGSADPATSSIMHPSLDHGAKDSGLSRFIYCAKISTRERNAGMDDKTNGHPTVKPQKLMRYLITMITPPGGTVLDPFAGSGSTGCAAVADGFKFIGIERDAEYVAIAEKRIFNSFPKATKQYHLGDV